MPVFVRDKPFYRTLFAMAGVIALQNLVTFGVNLADNVMIGAYSQNALNGVAIVNQIQFLLQMFANGVANGVAVLAAQYWGARRTEPVKRVYAVGFWLGMLFSAALCLLVFFFPKPVLSLLTNETAVIAEGAQYARIMSLSYGIFTANILLIGLMRSVETARLGFYASIAALFINIFLNYGLIYGRFGMPELGIRGAAIATVCARLVEFAVVVIYVLAIDQKLRLRLRDHLRVERGYIRDFAKSGLPLVASGTSWGVAMALQTAIIGRLGEAAISANSIATTIFQVVSVLSYGIASASGVVIGKAVGEERLTDVRAYAKTLQVLYLLVGIVTAAALFGAKQFIVSLYDITPDSAALAHQFILVLCVTVIGTSYQMPVLTGIVSGGGQTNFVLINDMIFMWGIVLPVSFLSAFVMQWPPVVTFICLKSDQIMKCAVAAVKVNRYRWIRVLTRGA